MCLGLFITIAAGFAVYRAHRGAEQIQHQIRRCNQPLDSGCDQNRISTLWSHARQSLSIHSSAYGRKVAGGATGRDAAFPT